jgi:hypothetical protein
MYDTADGGHLTAGFIPLRRQRVEVAEELVSPVDEVNDHAGISFRNSHAARGS